MAKKGQTISDALRQAIVNSGMTTMDIERDTGVNNSQLSRFLRGERGLSLSTVDKLAWYLGLGLVERKGR